MDNQPTLPQNFGRAVSSGDLKGVRDLLQHYPELLTKDRLNYNLWSASRNNNVPMMALLVELGADEDAAESGSENAPESCIYSAASFGALEAVRWLLERGAKINHTVDGQVRCLALTGAAIGGHLDVVRVLCEHDAEINATWNGQNPLSFAILYGNKDVEAVLRSKGAKTPQELLETISMSSVTESSEDLLLKHIREYLGQPQRLALRTIIPTDPPIAIHVVELRGGKALVTVGMSTKPLSVPSGEEQFQFVELVIYLPDQWPLDEVSLRNPDYFWPIEWLRRMSLYFHESQTWLGGKTAVIATDGPPKQLAPNTRLTCFLALNDSNDLPNLVRSDGTQVIFYSIYPLYTEERDLEKKEGTIKLLQLFQKHRIGRVIDPHRENVALNETT